MPRILSQHGNVIAADFGKPRQEPTVSFDIQILYADDRVCLNRITYAYGGIPIGTHHLLTEI